MSVIGKNMKDKVAVLLDLQNTECYMRGMGVEGAFIDYESLVAQLAGGRRVVSAYIFDSCTRDEPKWKFIHDLERKGFRAEIREYINECHEQKEVDVALATRLTALAYDSDCDVIILVSGDRDFVPAVEEAQRKGKIVEVASFDKSISERLANAADRYTRLDRLCVVDISNLPAPADPADVFDDEGFVELSSPSEEVAEAVRCRSLARS